MVFTALGAPIVGGILIGGGGYDVVTGVFRTIRGGRQMYRAVTTPCKVDCSAADNLTRAFYGIIPDWSGDIIDQIGGTP